MGGWKAHISKPATMPYNPNYPKKDPKWERQGGADYCDFGFKKGGALLQPSTPIDPHAHQTL